MIGHMSSTHPTSDSTTKQTVSAAVFGFDPTAGSDSCNQPGEEREGEETPVWLRTIGRAGGGTVHLVCQNCRRKQTLLIRLLPG